jgi:hypothetical protein
MELLINLILVNICMGVIIAELCRFRYHIKTIGKFSRALYVIIVFMWLIFLIRFIYTGVKHE